MNDFDFVRLGFSVDLFIFLLGVWELNNGLVLVRGLQTGSDKYLGAKIKESPWGVEMVNRCYVAQF